MPSGRFINLRAKTFKESDLLVDVLSKEGERLTLSAKNAVKSKRRFSGGVLEPLNFVEIQYTQSKSGFLYIQEAKIINSFAGLRTDYKRLECAFHLLKLISKVTHEGLKDGPQLFDLLGNTLKVLETTTDPQKLKLHFELKFLYSLGFLAMDSDTEEFVNKPMNLNSEISLTEDESLYLNQFVRNQLKQVEILSHDENF